MAYYEPKNPETGKSPKHQDAANKAFGQGVSNAEVKPSEDEYEAKLGFSSEEVELIENEADAELENDDPDDEARGKIYKFNDGSEWLIFDDADSVEKQAVEYVESMLENEPEMFSQDWLQNHVTMSDTDRGAFANDESSNYAGDLTDEDAIAEADFDGKEKELQEENDLLEIEIEELEEEKAELESTVEDEGDENGEICGQISDIEGDISIKMNKVHMNSKEQEALPNEARDKVQEDKYEEIYADLEDPVGYFIEDQGLFSIEELLDSNLVSIDTEEAAQDAIYEDGAAHFLAGYDGNEVELDNGMIMFRTN